MMLVIAALVFFSSVLFVVRMNEQLEALYIERQQIMTDIALDPVYRRTTVIHNQAQLAAQQLLHNKPIIEAFVARDRQALATLVDELMILYRNSNIDLLHFHLPDGTTFYRGHDPNNYGDLLDFRASIIQMQSNKHVIYGLEQGLSGVNYRYIVPVFNRQQYIGSFEVGVLYDQRVLEIFKRAGAGEWHLVEFDSVNNTFGKLLYSTTTDNTNLKLCAEMLAQASAGIVVECNNHGLQINLVPVKNFQGEIEWAVVRTYDNLEFFASLSNNANRNIGYGLLLAAVLGAFSYFITSKLFAPLDKMRLAAKSWGDGDLTHKLTIVKTRDEIELLSETMEKMRHQLQDQKQELEASNYELEASNQRVHTMYAERNKIVANAAAMHKLFLPNRLAETTGVDVAAWYSPADLAGGDFYYTFLYNKQLVVYTLDVSGHALDGAFLSLFIHNNISRFLEKHEYKEQSKRTVSPAQLVNYLVDEYLEQKFPDDYHFAATVVVYDPLMRTITHCNAGNHILPIFVRSGNLLRLGSGGLPISCALDRQLMNYQEHEIKLKTSDWTLAICTDGIVEERNRYGEEYGESRLETVFLRWGDMPAEHLLDKLKNEFRTFTGGHSEFEDDITVVVLTGNKNKTFI